jgi:flagellar FliJ protein
MFKFRLQHVLDIREEREKVKARELAAAKDAAEIARQAQEALASLRDNSRAEVEAAHEDALPVGHLHQFGFVLESLEQRLQHAGESVNAAEGVVEGAQGALNDAARDRRMLDRLKERHTDAWRVEEAQKDRLHMDAIALTRFGNKSTPNTPKTTS